MICITVIITSISNIISNSISVVSSTIRSIIQATGPAEVGRPGQADLAAGLLGLRRHA